MSSGEIQHKPLCSRVTIANRTVGYMNVHMLAGCPLRPPLPAFASPLALALQQLAVGGDFLLEVGLDAQEDLVFAVLPLQVTAQLQQFLLVVGDDALHVLELAGVPRLGLR